MSLAQRGIYYLNSMLIEPPDPWLGEVRTLLAPCQLSLRISSLERYTLSLLCVDRAFKSLSWKGDRRGFLNWKQRFSIIVSMARGLSYLHQEFHVCTIHRDIKCSNILLDNDFQPRIADFVLANLLPEDKTHLNTRFAGTFTSGYAIHGQLSEKVDTYSFGVVLLEIISGRKSNDANLEPDTQYLLEWAWKQYERERLIELVDETLDPIEFSPEEVKRIIKIAPLCTQSAAAARPTMSEIVVMLLGQSDNTLELTRPTLIDATSRVHGETSATHAILSVSQVSAR